MKGDLEMRVIPGFGVIEKEFEENELNFVDEFIQNEKDKFKGNEFEFIPLSGIVGKLNTALHKRSDNYEKLAKEYDKAKSHPDRYSYYYFNILTDNVRDLCIVLKFMHTSRIHLFSPDGWGLFEHNRLYYIDTWEQI